MRVVILVPRREDNGPRDAAWEWCKARWERLFPDWPIYEGHHLTGPFNRARAVNTAARLAGDWDLAIVIDADIFLRASQVQAAVDRAAATGKVTWAHRRWRGLHEEWTTRTIADQRDFGPELDGTDMDILVERTNPISWSCCIVFPRKVWDDMGGFDERFVGWGFEDMAVQSLVAGLYGHERIEGDVYHLYHPRVFGSGRADKERGDYTKEAITNARLGRRYMLALRRDHGLHDRPGLPASEEERQRDIGNLVRDDAKLADQAKRLGLPNWSEWWPTLEQLRDGAKAHMQPAVTLVVITGGLPETWEQRRGYLEKAIASLRRKVVGPITKRVIYATWPDDEIRDWLRASFPDFYVVGPTPAEVSGWPIVERHARSMQALFSYLAKRAQTEYVFLAEDDFIYRQKIDLTGLSDALRTHPDLAQVALLRQPVHPRELENGGVLGWPRESFTQVNLNGYGWLEHRNFWTNNPSLFRQSLTLRGWPVAHSSERAFGNDLLRDDRIRFGIWGDGEAWVQHIGEVRSTSAY